MSEYKFYMQKCSKEGVLVKDTKKDLEVDFPGLLYGRCDGIMGYGKPKNIYTESYADSSILRTYVPSTIYREATEIIFTFYFVGEASVRQSSLDSFVSYISDGYHVYWDTARNRKFQFTPPIEEIKPSEEQWHGSKPYFTVQVKVQNVNGCTSNT